MGRESRWKKGPNGWELEDPHRESREEVALLLAGRTEEALALMKKHANEDRAVLRERQDREFQRMFDGEDND